MSDLSSANLSWKGSSQTATIAMWLPAEFCLNHSESFLVNIWIIQNGFRQNQISVCCYALIWIIQHRFRKSRSSFRMTEFFWKDSYKLQNIWILLHRFRLISERFSLIWKLIFWIQKDSDLKIWPQTDSESIQKKSAWFSMNSEIFIHEGKSQFICIPCA